MKVECPRRALVAAAEFGVAPIADGHVVQPAVDNEIHEDGSGENRVRDQIASEPVERAADERPDGDDGQADFRIEILADIEVLAGADRAAIDGAIGSDGL